VSGGDDIGQKRHKLKVVPTARQLEGFQYDVWGNRTVPCLSGLGTSTLAPWSFDANTNRIAANTGWLYEATGRGNIVQEPSAGGTYRMYLYDSGNHQVAFCTQDPGGCVNADGPGRAGSSGVATVVARRDYRPFGEEIVPSSGDPRLNVAGYSVDTVRPSSSQAKKEMPRQGWIISSPGITRLRKAALPRLMCSRAAGCSTRQRERVRR